MKCVPNIEYVNDQWTHSEFSLDDTLSSSFSVCSHVSHIVGHTFPAHNLPSLWADVLQVLIHSSFKSGRTSLSSMLDDWINEQ